VIDELKRQLIRHEGLRLKPYRDSVGKLTIGVGRNLDDIGITEHEAAYLLETDISRVLEDLDRNLPWWRELSEARQLVLADMCFNLGITKLLGFKQTLQAVKEGRYHDAANHMGQSRWAVQVGNRAKHLQDMMRTG